MSLLLLVDGSQD